MNRKKILTVDDYPLAAYTVKKTIQAFSKFNCEIQDFENPRTLLETFQKDYENIDMVVTDFEMPELRGNELIVKLREIKPDTKIVVISAWLDSTAGEDQHLVEKEVKTLKPDLIFSKPFPNNWIEQLDEVLAR